MKKIVSLLLAAALCGTALLTGCAKETSAVESIKSSGKIVMYTNAAFPPFEYMDGEKVAGVDVDIANEIAAELGVTLEIENVDFDSIVASIQSGKGDFGAAGMSITPERQESVDFSIQYITSKQYIIMAEGATIATVEDLAGKKIGVQSGTTGDFIISDEVNGYEDDEGKPVKGVLQGTGASVQPYENAIDATAALKAGKIDAVIIDKLPAENIVASNTGLKTIELVYADGGNTEEQYAICVKKGSDLIDIINTVLERLLAEGKIDEYVIKHSNKTAA